MHVSASIGVNEIVVSIADTGPGIPEEEQARVQREGAPKGLGLGLAFCKMAVEAPRRSYLGFGRVRPGSGVQLCPPA